jgi:hypothetical protein
VAMSWIFFYFLCHSNAFRAKQNLRFWIQTPSWLKSKPIFLKSMTNTKLLEVTKIKFLWETFKKHEWASGKSWR